MRKDDPTASLLKLLDEERSCVLEGRTADLSELASRKEMALSMIETSPPGRSDLIRLARAMARQEALLLAYRDGVRGAQQRLAELRSVRSGLNHYTKNGTVETISARQPGVEKRA